MSTTSLSRGRVWWYAVAISLQVVVIIALIGPWADSTWDRPGVLFTIVTVAAVACVFAATVLIMIADRRKMAEIGLLGSGLIAASVMPMVHGLTTPGVVYEETAAFDTAAFLSLPVAIAACMPLITPHSSFGRWAARRWRDWTILSMLGVFVLGAVIVTFPNAIVAPGPTEPVTIAITLGLALMVGALSRRQLRMYELGDSPANLIASVSLVMLIALAIIPMTIAYSPAFWLLHAIGALGVVGACAGMAFTKHMSSTAHDILSPVLVRDPLMAFELGLSPIVYDFVASLEEKDETTRDHVIRTGEMAIRVGERFNLSATRLRNLGLAAMLHDVGKLHTPDDILKKPARLTADEYETIKLHPVYSEEMFLAESTLASAAPIVRSHHERMDGRGYPDGLAGQEIPLEARIIAACDALDAMTNDRPYRAAMSVGMAFAVLREHAGSQWDPTVIQQVMAVYPTMPVVATLDHVGRETLSVADLAAGVSFDDLADVEIPDDVAELLKIVDAEI